MAHPPAPLGFQIADAVTLGWPFAVPREIALVPVGGAVALRYGPTFGPNPAEYRLAPIGESALDDFQRLGTMRESELPAAVLAVAERWGPLQLCERHLRPFAHDHEPGQVIPRTDQCNPCQVMPRPDLGPDQWSRWTRHAPPEPKGSPSFHAEPVSAWGAYARSLRMLLLLFADVAQGHQGSQRHWQALAWSHPTAWGGSWKSPNPLVGAQDGADPYWPPGGLPAVRPGEFPRRAPSSPDEARLAMRLALTTWLNLEPLPLIAYAQTSDLSTSRGGATRRTATVWGVTLRSGTLIGRIISELTSVISAPEGPRVYRCDHCHEPYLVPDDMHHRRPSLRIGRAHFCPDCGKRSRWSASKAKSQRARRAAAALRKRSAMRGPAPERPTSQ